MAKKWHSDIYVVSFNTGMLINFLKKYKFYNLHFFPFQTCMTKDITLHVSATNPAVVLYQKFGFKIEEVILNFYEKYLPFDSKQSRHAFFLRLMR